MNLAKYVAKCLLADGYDGLCCDVVECGCGTDDLMPCGDPGLQCQPAWLCVCAEHPECEHHGDCDTEGEGSGTCYRPGRKP